MKNQIIAVCFILLLTVTLAPAQFPGYQWGNAIAANSSGADLEGWAIAADANGNVYVTGSFYGDTVEIGGSQLVSPGGAMFLVKYDSTGTVMWVRMAGGGGINIPGGIACDSYGNIIVAGSFQGDSAVFGGTVIYNNNTPDQNFYVAKYDSIGNILWVKSTDNAGNEWVESVATDSQDHILLAGSFDGFDISIDATSLLNSYSGTEDVFLYKLDPMGNAQWARRAGGANYEWANGVTCDPFGNVVIGGPYFSDTLNLGTGSLVSPHGDNHSQMFIISYDSAGTLNWARQVTLTALAYDSYFYDVASDVFGNVYAVGSCNSDTAFADTLQLIASPGSNRDMLLFKYDVSGNLLWGRREFGTGNVYGFDLAVNTSNEAYVTGYFDCDSIIFGSDTSIAIDPWFWSDMFVVKYLPAGGVDWVTHTGGVYLPGSWGYKQLGITANSIGQVFVTGTYSNDSIVFGTDTLLLNNCWPNMYVGMIDDMGSCTANFSLVADTALLHHYWAINQATGIAPLSYYWEWGDGTYDTTAYPSHTYANAGFYTICLTITDGSGCDHTQCQTNNLQRYGGDPGLFTMVEVNVVPYIPTAVESVAGEEWSVYPNPSTGMLYINAPPGVWQLFNSMGHLVGGYQMNKQSKTLDLTEFPEGVYFMKLQTGEDVYTKTIMLIR